MADRFIGRDLWVKCHYFGGDYFIKFTSKDNDPEDPGYIGDYIRAIHQHLDDDRIYLNSDQRKNLVYRDSWFSIDRLSLIEPIECYTTEELFVDME